MQPPSRRTFLKKTALTAGGIAAATWGVNVTGKANNPDAAIIGHGDYRYRVNQAWGVLDAAQTPVFNCHEMVQDAKRRLIMVTESIRVWREKMNA